MSMAFAGETPLQRAKHREIARKYRRKGRPAKNNIRLGELNRLLNDRFGHELPALADDDTAAGCLLALGLHLARLSNPEMRIREMIRLRAPWLDHEVDAVITKLMTIKIKLDADRVGKLIRLDDKTRTRLKITTIGAVDCTKAQRQSRRKKLARDRERARRLKAGAKPHAEAIEHAKPWIEEGISRATYFRKRKVRNEPRETDSCAAQ